MATWLNHVAIAAPRNGTTGHTVDPSGGTVVAGSSFTPTSGRLLVCVMSGPNGGSTTPSGWTKPSAIPAWDAVTVYLFHRTAAGSDTVTVTHDNTNLPCLFEFFEFASGSTFVGVAAAAAVANGGAGPSITGLTGTNLVIASMGKQNWSGDVHSVTWSAGTEIVDTSVINSGTNGYTFGTTHVEDYTGSSWSSAATCTMAGTHERITFAVTVASSGTNYTSSPADAAGITDAATLAVGRAPADTAGGTDQASFTADLSRAPADPAGMTDTVGLARSITVADALGITDTGAEQTSDVAVTVADSLGITDTVTGDLTGGGSASASDGAGATDQVATVLAAERSPGDSAGISDAASTVVEASRGPADAAGASDAASTTVAATRSSSDAAGATDLAEAVLDAARAVVDAAGMSDLVQAVLVHDAPIPRTGVEFKTVRAQPALTTISAQPWLRDAGRD